VTELDDDLYLVLHLMIAGRLRLREPGQPLKGKVELAAFDFTQATFVLTEAGTKKRASLHVVQGRDNLAMFDRGGIDPFTANLKQFREALVRENRTLKRARTDPRIMDGTGNAYSDEIPHRARPPPVKRVHQRPAEDSKRLQAASRTRRQARAD